MRIWKKKTEVPELTGLTELPEQEQQEKAEATDENQINDKKQTADKKRRSFWSSRMVQNLICMLSLIVLVADMAGIVLFADYYNLHDMGDILELLLFGEYEESEEFWNTFVNEADTRIAVEKAKQMYQDLNVAENNGMTMVDLGYLDHLEYGDELTGITYYLADLVAWWDDFSLSKLSAEQYESISLIKQTDPYYRVESTFYGYQYPKYECVINERYYPVGDEDVSLYEYADSPELFAEYSGKLQRTIQAVKEMSTVYRTNLDHYNLHAALVDGKSGLAFSSFEDVNAGDSLSISELHSMFEERVKKSGRYLIYEAGSEIHSNIDIPYYRSYLEISYFKDLFYLEEGDILYLWVDDTYPGNDELREGWELYHEETSVLRKMLCVLPIALVLFLVSFIRRIMLEGRGGQKERKIRNWKTEFLIMECIAVGIGVVAILYPFMNEVSYYLEDPYILSGICIGVCCFMALILSMNLLYFGMELIRRLKARTFYKKSLLYVLITLFIRFVLMLNGKIRWAVGYLVFLLVNFLAVLSESGPLIVLMAILDLAIGTMVILYFKEQDQLRRQMESIAEGKDCEKLDEKRFHLTNRNTAEDINRIDLGIKKAVDISMRDERMKTELITNVSHDIKTPLTSIITYVDLLAKEPLETENEKQYVEVLTQKANRLKQLIDDLMEASKINSGNIAVVSEKLCMGELISQISAEYETRLEAKQLQIVYRLPEENLYFSGDSRHVWRVFSNLFSNLCKYTMPGTRVYLEADRTNQGSVCLEMKNISEQSLNISPEELTERFVRGDESRNTEGNGLGLSIAKSLMQAMGGEMKLFIDGDLFKVRLIFPE